MKIFEDYNRAKQIYGENLAKEAMNNGISDQYIQLQKNSRPNVLSGYPVVNGRPTGGTIRLHAARHAKGSCQRCYEAREELPQKTFCCRTHRELGIRNWE